jgi:hypothetical protein
MVNDQGELVGIVSRMGIEGRLFKGSDGKMKYADEARLISRAVDIRNVHVLLQEYPGH